MTGLLAEASGLSLGYGNQVAVTASSFTIPHRAVTAIIGPNGSGKSTVLNALAGVLEPLAGTLSVLGVSPRVRPPRVSYVMQSLAFPAGTPITVREAVGMGLYPKLGWFGRPTADDRARVARDLHDQLGASLTQIALLGELAEADKDLPAEVESHAKQISQAARDTTRVLDEIVWAVNPSNDTLEGLVNYLCKYAQEYLAVGGVRYRLEAPPQLPARALAPEARHHFFLAAKEAVTNIVRHAHATEARVRVSADDRGFTMEIEDNGKGVPPEIVTHRNGLKNMRLRMESIGGSFEIGPAGEKGARVRLYVPWEK